MKERIVCALFLLALCLPLSAEVITPSQALTIAEEFLGESLAPQHVRGMRGTANVEDEQPAPLYIISRGEDRGWIVVSGDDCLPAVIGYTDSGNFDADDMSPAYRDMLNCVTAAVTAAQEAGIGSRPQPMAVAEGRETIFPLLTCHWNQGSPWNLRCPICPDNGERALAGCTAIAASQVVYYFRKDLPGTLLAPTPTYKGEGERVDVTESIEKGTPIRYELLLDSYSNSEPEAFKDAVATLCFAIGAAAEQAYGHSTSGYISRANNAMRSHFGLGGTHIKRRDMALSDWEEIIYNSLKEKKPLLYRGGKIDGGGHAINLDGYNAKNGLWHFNFGWSGKGDGWYTLDLETGVNGYCVDQYVVYGITPAKQNVSGLLEGDDILYRRVYNTMKARITNNSTLGVKGFHLYFMTTDKAPNNNSIALGIDNDTWIEPGETVEISFKVRPSLTRDYYAYLTDSQRNVLDHCKVTVIDPSPDFSLNALDGSASNDIVTEGGLDFRLLHNKSITLSADITNGPDGTPGQPSVEFQLFKWNPATGKDSLSLRKTVSLISFEKGERLTLSHTFKNLADDTYYIGRIRCDGMKIETPDSIVRFVVGEKSLALDTVADGVATFSGGWDANLFATLATDPAVCVYDLTAVSGVTSNASTVSIANPNALFYVKGDVTGRNIISDGHCTELSLTGGYDFRPLAPFHADHAEFAADYAPAIWNTLTLPFECNRPEGWLCRYVTAFSASYVKEAVTADVLLPSRTYIVMADSRSAGRFTATDVDVMAAVDTTLMSPFIGTFHAVNPTPLMHEGDTYILSLDTDPAISTQYFTNADTTYILPPFQSVISSSSKKIRATANNTLETAYKKLAAAIDEAQALYDKMHAQITDSANQAMEALLAEAHGTFFLMAEETTATITALTKTVTATIKSYPLMLRHITRPVDFSLFLTNPSFETNNKSGWKSDAYSVVKPLTNLSTYGAFADGKYLLYNNKAGASTGLYQTVTGLPEGYYRATAMLGTDEGGVVTFYANDQEAEVPASEFGKYYLSEAVIDSIRVENGEITIGVRSGSTWYKADDFRIHYLGHLYNDDVAIEAIEADDIQPVHIYDNAIYDLLGRRLSSPDEMKPGMLYIRNGRKLMRIE